MHTISHAAPGIGVILCLAGIVLLGMGAVPVLFLGLRRTWRPGPLFGLLSAVWFFATPYAHANDLVLLVPAALALAEPLLLALDRVPLALRAGLRLRARDVLLGFLYVDLTLAALATLHLGGLLLVQPVNVPLIPSLDLPVVLILVTFAATWPMFTHALPLVRVVRSPIRATTEAPVRRPAATRN